MAPARRGTFERGDFLQVAATLGLHAQKKSFLFQERRLPERQQWLAQLTTIAPSRRVYLDEAGADDTLSREYGWSWRGTRCAGQRRGHAKERISMVAAWCQGQVMAPWTFTGSCDAEFFELWFQTQLLPQLQPGQVVILDNATFHRKKVLSPMLEEVGCSLLPLPAYSPDFNPIESLWHQIKHRIRYNTNPALDFWQKVDAAFCSL